MKKLAVAWEGGKGGRCGELRVIRDSTEVRKPGGHKAWVMLTSLYESEDTDSDDSDLSTNYPFEGADASFKAIHTSSEVIYIDFRQGSPPSRQGSPPSGTVKGLHLFIRRVKIRLIHVLV